MATIHDPTALTSTATQYILSTYFSKVFLERLVPELRWYQVAEKKRLPKNAGKIVKFSSFKKLAVGTRLSEAIKPTPKTLSTYNVSCLLGQWGDYAAVSDLMEVTGITSTVTEAVSVMGEHAALTIDTQIRNAAWGGGLPSATSRLSASLRLRNTGSVSALSGFNNLIGGFTIKMSYQCSAAAMAHLSTAHLYNASAFDSATVVTLRDIRLLAVQTLRERDVKPKNDGYYVGIAHPAGLANLMSDTSTGGWIDWQKYSTAEPMYKGEVGRAEGVRFVSTTNAIDKPLNTGAVISASVMTIMGQGALGVVDFQNTYDGKGQNYIIIKKANAYNTDDPLNQIAGTVGWKCTIASVVLNTSCGIHLLTLRN